MITLFNCFDQGLQNALNRIGVFIGVFLTLTPSRTAGGRLDLGASSRGGAAAGLDFLSTLGKISKFDHFWQKRQNGQK